MVGYSKRLNDAKNAEVVDREGREGRKGQREAGKMSQEKKERRKEANKTHSISDRLNGLSQNRR